MDKINKIWGRKAFNLQIELMGWEDTIGAYGRPPQENINADLAKCELFLGMLWYEWGSSNIGRKYASGFEEEFHLAADSHKAAGRPAIHILFKQVDEGRPGGTGPGYARIKEFKEEIRSKVLWHGFADESEFREKIETILSDYIIELHQAETQKEPQAATDEVKGDSIPTQPSAPEDENPQLPPEALSFVREFADHAAKDATVLPVKAAEIARFRLLGTLLSEHGNDDTMLGVHDANTLFVHSDELSLAWREYAALAECGVVNLDAQNAPVWRWLVAANGLDGLFIPLRTIWGSEKLRIGMFKLMRLMATAHFESEAFTRDFYLEKWFAADNAKAVREAALGYLGEFGTPADLPKIQEEIERADYQTLKAAIHAYAAILSRESVEKALGALMEHQSDSVETGLLKAIFQRPSMLPTPLLEQGVSHRATEVRRMSATELNARQKITREIADVLVADAEPEVRLQGLLARVALGDRVPDDEARTILVKRRIRSGFNALAMTYPSTEGDAQLQTLLKKQKESVPRSELKREAAKASIFDQELVFEEIRRAFKTRGGELRAGLRDGFADWFTKTLAELEVIVGQSETLEKTKKLEDSLRNGWMREAFAIVIAQGDCQDLPLVRDLVATKEALLTAEVVEYLAECGEWADVALVLRFSETKPSRGVGLLGYYMPAEEVAVAARALLKLGKKRVRDVLGLTLDNRIRAQIIASIPATEFRQLSDDEIAALFKSENDAIRRTTVIRAVAALPLTRLKKLMARHLDPDEKRFYNVGVWLDLGVTLDRATASAIAKRALGGDD